MPEAPGFQGCSPVPARSSATPPGTFTGFAMGREALPLPPPGHCCSSGTHRGFGLIVSCLSIGVQAGTENSCSGIGTMTRLDYIVQSVAGTKWLLSRNLITESSNVQDAKNYMRQSTNSLLKFDMRFRIWLKGFFFFLTEKALCYTILCQSQYQVQQSVFPNGLLRHLNSLTKLSNSLENVLTKSDFITKCIYTGFIQYGAHFFKFCNDCMLHQKDLLILILI